MRKQETTCLILQLKSPLHLQKNNKVSDQPIIVDNSVSPESSSSEMNCLDLILATSVVSIGVFALD